MSDANNIVDRNIHWLSVRMFVKRRLSTIRTTLRQLVPQSVKVQAAVANNPLHLYSLFELVRAHAATEFKSASCKPSWRKLSLVH
eukprot:scaffold7227_cov160-Amphora_coffeaeformis.AAC.6